MAEMVQLTLFFFILVIVVHASVMHPPQSPVPSPPPPTPSPPSPSDSSNCPPPPSSSGTYYYSPPPPPAQSTYYYSPLWGDVPLMKQQVQLSATVQVATQGLIEFVKQQSYSGCNRSCGDQVQVPYPFGFSESCEIRLNCTKGLTTIGEFQAKVTTDSILVNLPGKCNRSIAALTSLFGKNYGLTWRNGLLLQNCTSPPRGCVLPRALLKYQLKGISDCDEPYCFSKERSDDDTGYMAYTDVENSSCKFLVSSAAVDGSRRNISLTFETVQLGWWLEGGCNCSNNANCTQFLSPVTGKPVFRCRCGLGFKGDGFMAGNGCRKGAPAPIIADYGQHRKRVIIGVSAGAGSSVLILILLLVVNRKRVRPCYNVIVSYWKKKTKNPTNVEVFLENYGCLALQRYKYSAVKKMTNSFKEPLGQGGYGSVFKGKLRDGRLVAVKVLIEDKGKGLDFINEVAAIGRTNHVNVVSLLGFCTEKNKRALVYEYMPNGSLERFIYREKNSSTTSPLGPEKLYEITIGIARGLEYLHRGCNTRILHLDIKPHNILLDQDFFPKISDFGLAKLCPTKESLVSMIGTRGTPGYIAPEVYCRNFGGVSHKSDVYSYGMMVLEMIGGRKNVDATVENLSEIYFPHWVYTRLERQNAIERTGDTIIEVSGECFKDEAIKKMIIVALWCIQPHPGDRPSMSKVVDMLEENVNELQMPPNPFPDPSSISSATS